MTDARQKKGIGKGRPDSQKSRPRVMVVEDDDSQMRVIARILSGHFEVEMVANGREALQRILTARPDLVLSDIILPGLDGMDLVRTIRSLESTSSLPFILCSAFLDRHLCIDGIRAGANDFVFKPFHSSELISRIWMRLHESEAAGRNAAAGKPIADPTPGLDGLKYLSAVSILLNSAQDFNVTFPLLAKLTVPSFADLIILDFCDVDPERTAPYLYPTPSMDDPAGRGLVEAFGIDFKGHGVLRTEHFNKAELERIKPFFKGPDVFHLLDRRDLQSAVIVPLVVREITLGALAVFRGGDQGGFSDFDVILFESLGRRVAQSLDNRRLLSELRSNNVELERQVASRTRELSRVVEKLNKEIEARHKTESELESFNHQLNGLVRIIQHLNGEKHFSNVMKVFCSSARKLLGADGVTCVLREGGCCHYAEEDAIAPLWKGRSFPMNDCISGWAMVHQRPAAVDDIYADDRIPIEVYKPTFVKALAAYPMLVQQESIGSIVAYWACRHEVSPSENQILQLLADSAARALSSACAYENLEKNLKELVEADERLRAQQEQLSEAQHIAKICSWEWDRTANQVVVSEEFYPMFGLAPGSFTPNFRGFLRLVHPDDRPLVLRSIRDGLRSGQTFEFVHRVLLHGRQTKYMHTRGRVRFDSHGIARRLVITGQDITESKKLEMELEENRHMLNAVLESTSSLIFLCDSDDRILYFNRACERMWEHSSQEVLGKSVGFMFYPMEWSRVLEPRFQEVKSSRGVFNHVCPMKSKSGVTHEIEWRFASVRHKDDASPGILGTGIDVTERKAAERALKESECLQRQLASQLSHEHARLIEAQSAAKIGSWETEIPSLKVAWTEGTHEIFETDSSSFKPTHAKFLSFVHPADRERVNQAFVQSLKEREGFHSVEHRIVMRDWRIKVVEERWKVIHDENGRPLRAVGTCQDITERKAAEMELRRTNNILRALFDAAPVAVISFDLKGVVTHWSAGAEKMFGWTEAEAKGRLCPSVPPSGIRDFKQMISRVSRKGPESGLVRVRVKKDGETILAQLHPGPLIDSSGEPYGVTVILEDVTEQKVYENALQKAAITVHDEQGYGCLKGLAQGVAEVLGMDYALIGEYLGPESGRIRTLAQWETGRFLDDMEYPLSDTPCETVLDKHYHIVPDNLARSYPNDLWLREKSFKSFAGAALLNADGRILGNISVFGFKPVHNRSVLQSVLKIFAARATHEIERLRNQASLESYSERLKALSSQLLESQEKVNRQIARELHDQLGQTLTLLQIHLHSFQESMRGLEVSAKINDMIQLVDEMHGQVRGMSFDLHPSVLDDLGLIPAIRWYLNRLQLSKWVKVKLEVPPELESKPIPDKIQVVCFRFAQEAISNVLRHSKSEWICIRMNQDTSNLNFTIQDGGVGFLPEEVRKKALAGKSLGMLSMEERVHLAGGRLLVESAPGRGTSLTSRFPLSIISTPHGESFVDPP